MSLGAIIQPTTETNLRAVKKDEIILEKWGRLSQKLREKNISGREQYTHQMLAS